MKRRIVKAQKSGYAFRTYNKSFYLCIYMIYGWNDTFLVYLSLTYLLIAMTFVDIDHLIIPNGFVITGL